MDTVGSTVTATRTLYPFAGSMVAQRTSGAGSGFVYLHADHLGGVIATTLDTGRGGQAGSSARYLPWGGVRSGGIAETTVNFTGQHRDGLGLLYYGARYYDPALGRFLSPDSIGTSPGNPQSLNRYAYVLNNPVNHTDPSGHCPEGAGCNDQYGGAGAATGLDTGGGSGSGSGSGTDIGGNDGGGAAFADLVQAIDQIPTSHTVHAFTLFTPCNGDPHSCAQNNCTSVGNCFGGGFPGGSAPAPVPVSFGFGYVSGDPLFDTSQNPGGGGGGLPGDGSSSGRKPSGTLDRNLGGLVGDELDAHHIVPKKEPIGQAAREILEQNGIDIDSPENGVLLDPGSHPKNDAYYIDVNERLDVANRSGGGRQAVIDELEQIRRDILKGYYG